MSLFSSKKKSKDLPDKIRKAYLRESGSINGKICSAPWASLYFTPDGSVKSCCALADPFSFGKYPEKSIQELLQSEQRKKLQENIDNNVLKPACQSCYDAIIRKDYEGSISNLYHSIKQNEYPSMMEFELSHYCNLDCTMCYLHTQNKKKNSVYGDDFLEEIKPYLQNLQSARFFGGEPFLIPQYWKVWAFLMENNPDCTIHIQTNGTVYNERVENLLGNAKVAIGVSIDAMDADLFSQIRKGAKLENVLSNVDKFKAAALKSDMPLNIAICPMPLNIKEIPAILDYAEKMDSHVFFNTISYPARFSFRYLKAEKLEEHISFLKNFPENFSNEKRKVLESFLNGLNVIREQNAELEKKYAQISLEKILELLSTRIDTAEIRLLIEILPDDLLKYQMCPVLHQQVLAMDDNILLSIVREIVKHNDVQRVHDLFVTN